MKICAACCNELPQSSFSKKQWKLKQYERRCTDCINSNRELPLKPPPKTTNKEEDHKPTCYICLDDGLDELGEKVMRSCSCRGSAGYVHLSCAVNYAEQKGINRKKGSKDPWVTCPNCHQHYRGDLAMGMAKKRVAFVEKNYPHNHTMILQAQVFRLESLTSKNSGRSYNQTKEAEQVANSIIHKVGQMKLRRIQITDQDRVYEAYAYEILGCMIVEEGVKRKLPNALRYLEKSLEVSTANNYDYGIVRAKGLICMINSKLSGQTDDEENLKSHKMMYEQQTKKFGKSHPDPLKSGIQYAKRLKHHHFGVKAERLFIELYEISTRYHGPDHELTKSVRNNKSHYMARVVSVSSNEAGRFQSVQALSVKDYSDHNDTVVFYHIHEYDGISKRCVVNGPLICSNTTMNNEVHLSTDDIIFALGTPVVCLDSGNADIDQQLGDIRAWNNETKCYTVHWEDESLEPCEVHQSNIHAPSCICSNCMKGLELECVLDRK